MADERINEMEQVNAEAAAEADKAEAVQETGAAQEAGAVQETGAAQEAGAVQETEAAKAEVSEAPAETMADYAAELEASFKRIREGDILTGTVISVSDTQVILDLKYYAEGIIDKENLSNDPNFNMKEEIHPGDEITATVIRTDNGHGSIVLSRKEANDTLAWEKLRRMMEERTLVPVKITEIVNAGAVAQLEGIRGFIPASRLDAAYVENLEEWNGRTVEVTVITVDEERNKLVLSAREAAREKLKEEKNKKIAKCEVGVIMKGTVDSIKPYGAFINLDNGLSGLLHISQISKQRIKHPGVVLKEGQEVTVKILSTADNKISLSMKAVDSEEEPQDESYDYHESGEVTTGLGALLKGLKL